MIDDTQTTFAQEELCEAVEKPELTYKRDIYYQKFYGKGKPQLQRFAHLLVHYNYAGHHKTKEDEVMIVSVLKSVKRGFYPVLTTDKKGTVYFKVEAAQLNALKKDTLYVHSTIWLNSNREKQSLETLMEPWLHGKYPNFQFRQLTQENFPHEFINIEKKHPQVSAVPYRTNTANRTKQR